ncbi:MAG: hypothetical protein ACREDR_30975 [Blastocatellia bacterium]
MTDQNDCCKPHTLPCITTIAPVDPTVKFYFTGLLCMIVHPDHQSGHCKYVQVGIVHQKDHDLRIIVVRREGHAPGGSTEIVLDCVAKSHTDNIWVDVLGTDGKPLQDGINIYYEPKIPTDKPFNRRPHPDPYDGHPGIPKDFRWLVNFESEGFASPGHYSRLPFKPNLFFTNGTFYTHEITPDNPPLARNPVIGSPGNYSDGSEYGFTPSPFGRAALFSAADIRLNSTAPFMTISVGPESDRRELVRVGADKFVSYEIVIENGPPQRHDACLTDQQYTDFLYYYSVYSDMDAREVKYDLPYAGESTQLVPCLPCGLNPALPKPEAILGEVTEKKPDSDDELPDECGADK